MSIICTYYQMILWECVYQLYFCTQIQYLQYWSLFISVIYCTMSCVLWIINNKLVAWSLLFVQQFVCFAGKAFAKSVYTSSGPSARGDKPAIELQWHKLPQSIMEYQVTKPYWSRRLGRAHFMILTRRTFRVVYKYDVIGVKSRH